MWIIVDEKDKRATIDHLCALGHTLRTVKSLHLFAFLHSICAGAAPALSHLWGATSSFPNAERSR